MGGVAGGRAAGCAGAAAGDSRCAAAAGSVADGDAGRGYNSEHKLDFKRKRRGHGTVGAGAANTVCTGGAG